MCTVFATGSRVNAAVWSLLSAAELSVIAYHFDSKEDLVKEVVAEVFSKARDYMVPPINAASGGREKLRAYMSPTSASWRSIGVR